MQQRIDGVDPAKCAEIAETCTCLQLRKAARVVTRIFDETLRPSGLLCSQLPILITLSIDGSTPITLLAEKLLLDRTTLGRNLKPLEKQGLIEIVAGDDRRTREVALTNRGPEAVAKAIPFWERAQAHVVETLGQELTRELRGNLSAVLSLSLDR